MISIHRAFGAALNPGISTNRAHGAIGRRSSRLAATVGLGAALLLGTSGCALISPQATTIQYSAAEGVNVHGTGALQVRNAFIVADGDGSQGNLVAAIVNETDDSHTLRITLGEGSDSVEATVRVPARTVVSLGSDETEPLPVEGPLMLPGSDIPAYFESGDGGSLVSLPILDGELDYLAPLTP